VLKDKLEDIEDTEDKIKENVAPRNLPTRLAIKRWYMIDLMIGARIYSKPKKKSRMIYPGEEYKVMKKYYTIILLK
jgi:hypothetical protein